MLHIAFKDATDGVDIKTRFDMGLCGFKTSHFNAPTKVTVSTIHDLLLADDCALAATSLEALQQLCDLFAHVLASKVHVSKFECYVMLQCLSGVVFRFMDISLWNFSYLMLHILIRFFPLFITSLNISSQGVVIYTSNNKKQYKAPMDQSREISECIFCVLIQDALITRYQTNP